MEHLTLAQGSDEWLSARKSYFGASEASAMLGLSPYVTRNELLFRKATGIAKEYDDWFQAHVLDHGHNVEALARPLAEAFIGEDLYPTNAKDGRLWVSTDGLTMAEDTAWECKQWSEALAASIRANLLPEHHQPQCQQSLMLTGAARLLFTVSDGTEENTLHLWVYPDTAWFKRLRDGWMQFERDLSAYVVPPPAEAKLTGKTMDSLPTLVVQAEGRIVTSNLTEWVARARILARSINRTLQTDQDFADAETAIKGCEKAEARLAEAKAQTLAQTRDLEDLFRTVDEVTEEFRQTRLELDRLVKRRKEELRTEIVSDAIASLHAHIAELNTSVAPHRLPTIAADFGAAIKGKRNLESLRNAADTELARAKIEATNIAQAMRANLDKLAQHPTFAFLFHDADVLIRKDGELVDALIAARIAAHHAEQQRQAEVAAEAAREKIRAEERAKIEAEERERRAQAERDEQERIRQAEAAARHEREAVEYEKRRQDDASKRERDQAETDLHKLGQQGAPVAALSVERDPDMDGMNPVPGRQHVESIHSVGMSVAEQPAGTGRITPEYSGVTRIPESNDSPELAWVNLSKMNEAFGFRPDSKLIVETLGVKPARTERGINFWTPSQFEQIKRLLSAHVLRAVPIPF